MGWYIVQQKEMRTGVSHDMNLVGGVLCIRLDWNLCLVGYQTFWCFLMLGERERAQTHP